MNTVEVKNPLDDMVSIDKLIEKLARRSDDREHFFMPRSTDSKMKFHPVGLGDAKRSGIFTMELNGEEYEVSPSAISSSCRLMKTSLEFFSKNFPDWQDKLCNDFGTVSDNYDDGIIACTDTIHNGINRRVESFNSSKWNTDVGAMEIASGIADRLGSQNGSDLLGVQHQENSYNRTDMYRFVFGSSIIGENNGSVYPMLSLINSPYGFEQTELCLGLYRVVCSNGMVRQDFTSGRASWNQMGEPDNFFSSLRNIVDRSGDFSSFCASRFANMPTTELTNHPMEILKSLKDNRMINKRHYDAALDIAPSQTISTEFDMLNLLTDSAKDIKKFASRSRAEGNALKIAMSSGGFGGVMSGNFSSRNESKLFNTMLKRSAY